MNRTTILEYKLVTLSILLTICIHCYANYATPVIQTESGPVQGYVQETLYYNVRYSTFKGIQFAEPPTGNRRFKPPVPKSPWTEVYNATEEGPTCPQYDILFMKNTYMGEEDCLSLNVYTPVLDFNLNATYPVMVWIYGGAYVEGYKNQSLYGPDLLIEEGVIVVVPNYRLGVLGFLNLQHPDAHGNAGMMDQVLALKWVQKNIAKFGGDPNNVTLFGESAGSASIVLHNLSPQSEGLYQRSIGESGAPLILLSQSASAALVSAHRLANILGFDTLDKEKLLESYRTASAYDLVMSTRHMYLIPDLASRPFQPSIEDARVANMDEIFISECPITLMMDGQIRKGPKILGFNANELYSFAQVVGLDKLLPVALLQLIAQIISNVTMSAEIDLTQRFYAAHNGDHPVYYYVLTYTDFPHHIITSLPVLRTAHGDDLGLLFTSPLYGFSKSNDTNDPLNVFRRKFVRMWVNFAKGSNPTPKSNNPIDVIWEPSGSSGRQLEINWKSKMINRSLGASGSVPESIYYYRLPQLSGCRQISYATPFTHLFSPKEATIPPVFDALFHSQVSTSALSSKNIASFIRTIDFGALIKSFRLTSCFGSSNIDSLLDPHHKNPLGSSKIRAAIKSIHRSPAIHSFIDFITKDLSILWSSSTSPLSSTSSEEYSCFQNAFYEMRNLLNFNLS